MSDDGKRLTSGLYVRSQRGIQLRDEKVRRLLRKLRVECPWLSTADMPLARRFCELEVIVSQVYGAMHKFMKADEFGLFYRNTQGDLIPRGMVDMHRRLCQTQAALATQLGLTPAARMSIKANGRDAPIDIVAELAKPDVEVVEVKDGDGNGP
jgi:hypothetical protein